MAAAGQAGRYLTLAALALAIAGCTSPTSRATHAHAPPTATAPLAKLPAVRVIHHLRRPSALAVGPGGQLYLADDGLNEILRVLPGGRFAVIAGNGTAGFSGDGGPAVSASLNDPGGITVTRSGTLYIADMGNNRIRAVSPSGLISTVAGTGRPGPWWIPSGTPALKARLVSPADVAIGPDRALYIADAGASEILKMTRPGTLSLVAGTRRFAGVWGIGRRATQASADGPDGLAFDRAGDLFVAGFNTKTLLMITPSGIMTLPAGTDGFYPRDNGGLATAPDGTVVAMNTQQIDRITSHGIQAIYNLPAHPRVGIMGFLPDGIAVAANGTIYLDTWPNGYASKTALIEIRPGGTVRVLWQSGE